MSDDDDLSEVNFSSFQYLTRPSGSRTLYSLDFIRRLTLMMPGRPAMVAAFATGCDPKLAVQLEDAMTQETFLPAAFEPLVVLDRLQVAFNIPNLDKPELPGRLVAAGWKQLRVLDVNKKYYMWAFDLDKVMRLDFQPPPWRCGAMKEKRRYARVTFYRPALETMLSLSKALMQLSYLCGNRATDAAVTQMEVAFDYAHPALDMFWWQKSARYRLPKQPDHSAYKHLACNQYCGQHRKQSLMYDAIVANADKWLRKARVSRLHSQKPMEFLKESYSSGRWNYRLPAHMRGQEVATRLEFKLRLFARDGSPQDLMARLPLPLDTGRLFCLQFVRHPVWQGALATARLDHPAILRQFCQTAKQARGLQAAMEDAECASAPVLTPPALLFRDARCGFQAMVDEILACLSRMT